MSTPAHQALSGSNAAGAGGNSDAGAGTGADAGGGAVTRFYDAWFPAAEATKPEMVEAKSWLTNKNYQDPITLIRSAREFETQAATLRAGKGYPVAKPNADGTAGAIDANQWKAWNLAVGVPESPDKYDIPVPADNPYPQYKVKMAEAFHKLGVPAAMATGIAKANEEVIQALEAEMKRSEDTNSQLALLELQRAWGPQYTERMALANRGKSWLTQESGGLNDLQWRTLEAVLGTDKLLTMMWKIATGNREAAGAGGGNAPPFGGGSAAEAQAELDRINLARMKDPKSAEAGWSPAKYAETTKVLVDRIVAGMSTTTQQ